MVIKKPLPAVLYTKWITNKICYVEPGTVLNIM